jgi:sporulation protein YlmC with PRC-barrel domain
MTKDFLDISANVLDVQVFDANNVPCGTVDDIEIEAGVGTELRIKALLIGNGAASDRLPQLLTSISRFLFGDQVVRIPWSEVSTITDRIKLFSTADELGLGEGQSVATKIIGRLPGAWKK